MKKTKLLTSLAALALVLGLGACTEPDEEKTTSEEGDVTTTDTGSGEEGGTTTEGGEDETTSEEDFGEYTLIFTLYNSSSEAQKAPEYGSLYFQGSPTGSWNESGWWEWGDYALLTETTNDKGEVAYGMTIGINKINTGSDHTFNIVFTYEGEQPGWAPVREQNFNIAIPDDIADGDVQYVECTGCYTLEDQFPVLTNSCTIAVKDTATTGKSLKISGDFQGWNPTVMTYDANGTDYQYTYTFGVKENQSLNFGIYTLDSWGDALQVGTADTDGYVTSSGNNIMVAAAAIGTYANTLIVFTLDATNFGSTHVTTTGITISHD